MQKMHYDMFLLPANTSNTYYEHLLWDHISSNVLHCIVLYQNCETWGTSNGIHDLAPSYLGNKFSKLQIYMNFALVIMYNTTTA